MKKNAMKMVVWMLLGLMSLRAAPTNGYEDAPKWLVDGIWKTSATMRSYAEEGAKSASLGVSSDGISYRNDDSDNWLRGNGLEDLLSQINSADVKFTSEAGDPGHAKGHVRSHIRDSKGNLLFSAYDQVEATSTDVGWNTHFNLEFDLEPAIHLPLENGGDEIDGVEVYLEDKRTGYVANRYWLEINWNNQTVRYPTGLTGDLLSDAYDARIVFHRWNPTNGSYSQAFDLKTGEMIPLGEVTVVAGTVTAKGMVFSTTTAEVNPESSDGIGTLPLVVLTVSTTKNIVFGGMTTEGEKATGFRIRKLGPAGFTWQEYMLPDTGASLMQLDAGTYHIEYLWPTFREEERWIWNPSWWEGDGSAG